MKVKHNTHRKPPYVVKSVFVLNAYPVNPATIPNVIAAAINTSLVPPSVAPINPPKF